MTAAVSAAGWVCHNRETPPIGGVPYHIEILDRRTFSGCAAADGLLPRIDSLTEDEYTVYWGDEALTKMEAAKA